jgi:hypothetical protein
MKLAKRRRLRHAAALTVGLTLACLVVSGPALAEGGNSANAKLCQKGGWQDLQYSSGGSFANQASGSRTEAARALTFCAAAVSPAASSARARSSSRHAAS